MLSSSINKFEKFYKQHYKLSLLVAFRFVRDEAIAEDIVQDVFISLWQKRDSLDFTGKLKPYLLKSVKNHCINYISTQKENISLEIIPEKESTAEETSFETEEKIARLSQAIEKLPPKCKEIFLLVSIEGLKYQEAAGKLGISKNTVKTQMGIAFKLLRNIF